MSVLLLKRVVWPVIICLLWFIGNFPINMLTPSLDNEFLLLGKAVAQTFNLSSCWICGGPLGLHSWPWVSTPVHPSQLADNDSIVQNDTYGEKTPWFITYP